MPLSRASLAAATAFLPLSSLATTFSSGAVVVARTNDRDFWTFSAPSDANGHYTSLFHASDELDTDPVQAPTINDTTIGRSTRLIRIPFRTRGRSIWVDRATGELRER